MKRLMVSLAALSLGVLVTPAFADNIPYGNGSGTVGDGATSTTVTSTGSSIDIYFYGSNASDTDYIEVEDMTHPWTSGPILYNNADGAIPASTVGEEYILPTGNNVLDPGDTLVFLLVNVTTGDTYSSDPSLVPGSDDENHAYMTAYTDTGDTAITGIPAGTYVGFEDEPITLTNGVCDKTKSDCDYNDDQFVFVGVNAVPNVTPEPGSFALLGTAMLTAAGVIRRRFSIR